MAQDVSARLGIFGEPLMAFVGRKLGYGPAVAIAALLSIGCLAWARDRTAAVGRGVEVREGGTDRLAAPRRGYRRARDRRRGTQLRGHSGS
jgi:hypothetical protein